MEATPDDAGFDLTAASLRADGADLAGFVEALAVRLEGALPELCEVTRRRKALRPRSLRVERIRVQLGKRAFLLHRRQGELVTEVHSAVHDKRRAVEEVALDQWLEALQQELRVRARSSAAARAALERLLGP
jgi:hypothetical protein